MAARCFSILLAAASARAVIAASLMRKEQQGLLRESAETPDPLPVCEKEIGTNCPAAVVNFPKSLSNGVTVVTTRVSDKVSTSFSNFHNFRLDNSVEKGDLLVVHVGSSGGYTDPPVGGGLGTWTQIVSSGTLDLHVVAYMKFYQGNESGSTIALRCTEKEGAKQGQYILTVLRGIEENKTSPESSWRAAKANHTTSSDKYCSAGGQGGVVAEKHDAVLVTFLFAGTCAVRNFEEGNRYDLLFASLRSGLNGAQFLGTDVTSGDVRVRGNRDRKVVTDYVVTTISFKASPAAIQAAAEKEAKDKAAAEKEAEDKAAAEKEAEAAAEEAAAEKAAEAAETAAAEEAAAEKAAEDAEAEAKARAAEWRTAQDKARETEATPTPAAATSEDVGGGHDSSPTPAPVTTSTTTKPDADGDVETQDVGGGHDSSPTPAPVTTSTTTKPDVDGDVETQDADVAPVKTSAPSKPDSDDDLLDDGDDDDLIDN